MRRRAAKIRKVIPDAKYGEVIVSRFVNRLMNSGKKSVVEKAIYESFGYNKFTTAKGGTLDHLLRLA